MKHEGEELTVEVVFEIRTRDVDGMESYHFPKPVRVCVDHKAADGTTQHLCLDGKGLAQLQILLNRVSGMPPNEDYGVASSKPRLRR